MTIFLLQAIDGSSSLDSLLLIGFSRVWLSGLLGLLLVSSLLGGSGSNDCWINWSLSNLNWLNFTLSSSCLLSSGNNSLGLGNSGVSVSSGLGYLGRDEGARKLGEEEPFALLFALKF